ncbi:MAG: DNA repair protein RecN [Actinobacteria bacterium]|nr:DNA repair protein RecN [Actinomycetota bacterium]
MLAELRVRNLGVIEDVLLELGPGMTALTGETGAGKTLIVEALQLVLGARAGSGIQRRGSDETVIEARFIDDEGDAEVPHELVLTRSVKAEGRSRAEIDGRMVPLSALASAGADLVDILGQNDHYSLLSAGAQKKSFDTFTGVDTRELDDVVNRVRRLSAELDDLGGDGKGRRNALGLLDHEIAEIDSALISDLDELTTLSVEEERLADLSAHREAIETVLATLDGDDSSSDPGAFAVLARSVELLKGMNSLAGLASRLQTASVEIADVASELRNALELSQDDPRALDAIQRRRRLLSDLLKKYGATLRDVLEYKEIARRRRDDLVNLAERARLLTAEIEKLEARQVELERSVRSARKAGIAPFTAALHSRLVELGMSGTRFDVEVSDDGAGEPIRFLLSANLGEALQPLAKVASGGELARAMLAVRLVSSGGPPTMVFDEVDAGIGGSAAIFLGRSLKEVASRHQVLVVTHLAQVAAVADHHVAVEKSTSEGRTSTAIRELSGQERIVEISRMLSGHPDRSMARAHAAELLSSGQR